MAFSLQPSASFFPRNHRQRVWTSASWTPHPTRLSCDRRKETWIGFGNEWATETVQDDKHWHNWTRSVRIWSKSVARIKSDMVQPRKIDDSQGDFRSAGWFIKTHGEDQQLTASRRFDSRTNWRGILRQLIPFEYSLACCFADTDVSSWTLESRWFDLGGQYGRAFNPQ